MVKQVVVVDQCSKWTDVKCPTCKRRITIHHEQHDSGINDDYGRLDLGQQNYRNVVCMNRGSGTYCRFAGNLNADTSTWSHVWN